eukprot:CAMPEP_0177790080 /NCGR_PEP_ID=MMETSP0491_2-20121128/23131_1 /TAXON_ID=63592 /ORGANISM="Tetraselmis chuii, Strain PLY429" /LENGTH=53 /DNA_ID=CAMNT_0019312065 /DNA_START=102 /DNA_END=263 /DNA_ORIENTATION=+
MSIATSSRAAIPRLPSPSKNSLKEVKERLPSPHNPKRIMYPKCRGSEAPVALQ